MLGIDIMIDEDLKPWLLEINGNPSLSIDFDPDKDKTSKKRAETIISPIDLYVKSSVIEDSILITRKKPENIAKIKKFGKFE